MTGWIVAGVLCVVIVVAVVYIRKVLSGMFKDI